VLGGLKVECLEDWKSGADPIPCKSCSFRGWFFY